MVMEIHPLQDNVHGLGLQTLCLPGQVCLLKWSTACTCSDIMACPGRTMTMEFTLTKGTPISKWWKPKLIFTGVSIMGVNPENKQFNRCGHDISFSVSLGHFYLSPRATNMLIALDCPQSSTVVASYKLFHA